MGKFWSHCIRFGVLAMAVCVGCSLFIPTTRQLSLDSCDGSIEVFKRTGLITCGHITWELHPQHAVLLSGDPRHYLSMYDRLYRSFKTFLGREPVQRSVRMLEQCPNGSPTFLSECPNGALETDAGSMYVWRGDDILSCFSAVFQMISPQLNPLKSHNPSYVTVHVTSSFFRDAFPKLAADKQEPLSASFIHEFGHVFMPHSEGDDGYIWDPVLIEDFASFFGVVAMYVSNEIEQRGEKYYWDGWCLRQGKPSVCDDYFETLSQANSSEYETHWNEFVKHGPAQGKSIHHYVGGMLAALYGEYVASGNLSRYAEAFRKLFHFYHREMRIPLYWRQNQEKPQSSFVVDTKVNVFVFLLSVYIKEDLSDRFRKWGYSITEKTEQSIKTLERSHFKEDLISQYVYPIAYEGLSLSDE